VVVVDQLANTKFDHVKYLSLYLIEVVYISKPLPYCTSCEGVQNR